jgi:hypothetical protein
VVGAAVVRAVLPAVAAVFRVVVTVLEIAAYTLVSIAGLGALSGLAYGGYRLRRALRRRAAARPLRVVSVHPVAPNGAELAALEEARTPPLGWPASWPLLTDEEIRR